MTTRSRSRCLNPTPLPITHLATKHPLPITSLDEPTSFTIANKQPAWCEAMTQKLNALPKNETWILVPPNPNQNVIGCKWVFKIKQNADGTIERHKARLVAKRYHQEAGLDYHETYSPVVKPTTI
jgi:Reverse transcriptase (RNA-dependent DNA polymerase)